MATVEENPATEVLADTLAPKDDEKEKIEENRESKIDAKNDPKTDDPTSTDVFQPPPVVPRGPAPRPTTSKLKESPAIPYDEPEWSGTPTDDYSFEIIKGGCVVGAIDLTEKNYWVFGRLPSCDVSMEHPSLSRHHAIVQYKVDDSLDMRHGYYLYDLDSTHGTFVNKQRATPKQYVRLHVGHVIKFGGSTRLHVLQGPSEDQDDERALTHEEAKLIHERQRQIATKLRVQKEQEEAEREKELEDRRKAQEGISWGMGDDAEEDEDDDVNPFAQIETLDDRESFYRDDPKKSLKSFFDREACELNYDVEEVGFGRFRCRIQLPIEDEKGEPIVAEHELQGKKKECVIQCAMEACRILDMHDVLRGSTSLLAKKKAKDWAADDFYDSDDDVYLDRTGDVQRKRQQRMKRLGAAEETVDTHDSLKEKLALAQKEIRSLEQKLERSKAAQRAVDEDDIDAYVQSLKSGALDTRARSAAKRQLFDLRQEEKRLVRLVNLTRPVQMPEIKVMPALADEKPETLKQPAARPSILERLDEPEAPKKKLYMPTDDDSDEEPAPAPAEPKRARVEVPKERAPPPAEEPAASTAPAPMDDDEAPAEGEQKRKPKPKRRSQPQQQEKFFSKNYCENDPDYALWMPPDTQAGDGKTNLNDKFGY